MAEKTILQDFLEKRPDIKDPARIVDRFCPEQAGYDPVYNKDCHKWTCLECWNRPVTSQKAFRDLQKMRELIARAEAAEAEIEQLRNEHMKIQYNGEELTVQELCARLQLAECRAVTAENDKASLLQDKRTTDLYIRDKFSGRIHRIGDECHDALWVDADGTVYYSNLQNGDGCSDHSRTDKNAGYEFMPSDFGELVV